MEAQFSLSTLMCTKFLPTPVLFFIFVFAILDYIAERFLGHWSRPFEISNFTETNWL